MNTSNNIRYISTEEKIQKALFSLLRLRKYNDISIKELCYEAGINRSSFYAHYLDINDLMIKTEQQLSNNIMNIFSPKEQWDNQTFVKLFDFLYKNQNFYKAYLDLNEQAFMEKNDFMKYIKILNNNGIGNNFSSQEKIYHMAFFAGGLKAISKAWLKNNCKESPTKMAEIIYNEYNRK